MHHEINLAPLNERRVRSVTRADWADLLDWTLTKDASIPIYQQVANFVRQHIVSGLIPAGSRLPSSRKLVNLLGVSRTTIITAYSQLLADGYIVGHIGSGTYVAHDAANGLQPQALQHSAPRDETEVHGLSERGQSYRALDLGQLVQENVPFNTGVVRVDGRTSAQWRQLSARHMAIDPKQLGYVDPRGDLALRREIAKYLAVARGVRCTEEQIILAAGAQQAMDLAIKVLLDPGDSVWVENPAYPLTALALSVAGMRLLPVPVDDEGIRVAEGIASHSCASAAFVTPSHQYPLGVSLSMPRRAQLLDWAHRAKAWIIEDDYDAEFRYNGSSLPALKALDVADRVIYVGSFSKVLFPGLRYGYLVVPKELSGAFAAARFLTDRNPPAFFAEILSEFMDRGYFVSHIRRMRNEYKRGRDVLSEQLKRNLGNLVDVVTPDQGMHLIAYLRNGLSDVAVAEEARKEGVVVRPISRFYRGSTPRSGLMLGFAGFDEHRIRSAVARLATVLKNFDARVARQRSADRYVSGAV